MAVKITSTTEKIEHHALMDITSTSTTGDIKQTATVGNIAHKAMLMLKQQAGAMAQLKSMKVDIMGMNKNLLPGSGSIKGALSTFTNMKSMLTSIQGQLSSLTSLGGMMGQLTSLTSAFSSLSSITSAFGSISSLAGSLSSFTSLGGALSSLTGASGMVSSMSSTITSAVGTLGSVASIRSTTGSLSSVSALSSSSVHLSNLSTMSYGPTIAAMSDLTAIEVLEDALDTMTLLTGLGIYLSQPGSTATILELQTLMSDINVILNSTDTDFGKLESAVTEVHNVMVLIKPDVDGVIITITALP